MKIEYIEYDSQWFIKHDGHFIGGRYESNDVAVYANDNLSVTDMYEIWMDKCKDAVKGTIGVPPISKNDIDAFIIAKEEVKHP
ncbi:hypothetical protein MHMKNFAF_00044 [Klebsiella phage vB_KpnS_2146-302]|nr:hypothetical protein MHMKNFAF_00044 [Klebsiella phage vB_KpnS_2146-302]